MFDFGGPQVYFPRQREQIRVQVDAQAIVAALKADPVLESLATAVAEKLAHLEG